MSLSTSRPERSWERTDMSWRQKNANWTALQRVLIRGSSLVGFRSRGSRAFPVTQGGSQRRAGCHAEEISFLEIGKGSVMKKAICASLFAVLLAPAIAAAQAQAPKGLGTEEFGMSPRELVQAIEKTEE